MDEGPRERREHEMGDEGDAGPDLPPLPSSLIPRWLAALVLALLIASGIATAWFVLR